MILGNTQCEGIDFTETSVPVTKMVNVRTLLSTASIRKWHVYQMDVHNTFLHDDLMEEVYMKPPPGFHYSSPHQVCRLRKSLYGLRQAPCCWFSKLKDGLHQCGFIQFYVNYSLFTYHNNDIFLCILIYVDDFFITANSLPAISSFKTYFCSYFHMKDLGTLKYFLGIEVARNFSGIYLCQRKYTLEIISKFSLLGVKPISTPIERSHQLAKSSGSSFALLDRYRCLVG